MDVLHNVDPATGREGVQDAVLRFVEGLDKGDTDLLASAFTTTSFTISVVSTLLWARAPLTRDVTLL